MEYFKKAIDFLVKNFIIIIPLYVAIAIPLFFGGAAASQLMNNLPAIIQSMISSGEVSNPMEMLQPILANLQQVVGGSTIGGFFGLILSLIAYPATAGLIKKGLAGEEIGLQLFVDSLKEYFVQYLLYFIGCIIVGLIIGVGVVLLFLILGLIAAVVQVVGVILMVLAALALIVFGIYFGVRVFSLWLPAMIIDKAGMFDGLKKGFEASKSCFWLLFIVSLLVGAASVVVSYILGFLGGVIIIGPLVMGAISTLSGFILMTFYMIVYKDKTQGAAGPATEPATET